MVNRHLWAGLIVMALAMVAVVHGMNSSKGSLVGFLSLLGSVIALAYCINLACGGGSNMPRARVGWSLVYAA